MESNTFALANSILVWARERNHSINALKLQKLMYFFHGWHLAIENQPGIDCQFEAWKYGPALSNVFHYFKLKALKPLKDLAVEIDGKTGELIPFIISNNKKREILSEVLEKYIGFSDIQLSSLANAEQTPWAIARERKQAYLYNEDIKDYFTRKALQSRQNC